MADPGAWLSENWGAVYGIGGLVVAGLVWLATFIGIWWFAAAKYELGGLLLGWMPGGIAATIAGPLIGLTWPLSLPLAWFGITHLVDRGAFDV